MMPGMNGYEVAAALKGDAGTRHIPLVILSALDDRNSRVHGLTSGAEEFLTKPVNRQELLLRVRNLLRLAQEPPTGEERRSEENG
jgi:DNA-binding response OmpR family regulator